MPLLLAALMGACALLIVMAPLYAARAPGAGAEPGPAAALAEREVAARAALQDLDLDHQLGNLADDDYRSLRERYLRRALAALKGRYDRERALDEAIEAQVRALRAPDGAVGGASGRRGAKRPPAATAPAARAAAEGETNGRAAADANGRAPRRGGDGRRRKHGRGRG
jgi:hypothetical protein